MSDSPLFPVPLSIILLLLSLIHLIHNFNRNPSAPLPFPHRCQAPLYLVAQTTSSQSLSYFLSQFPNSLPRNACFLISAPFSYPHHHSSLTLTPPTPFSTLILAALSANPSYILVLTDQTHFDIVRYGTGKDDISTNHTSSFLQILPNISAAHFFRGDDPSSVLFQRPVFPRGSPWQTFVRSGGIPSANLFTLPLTRVSSPQYPITHYVQQIANADPLFQGIAAADAHPLSDVLPPDATNELGSVAAVALEGGGMAPLPAAPVLYMRSTFWALAPLWCGESGVYDDVVRGYVVQKVLQVTGRGVLFVRGGVEVWPGVEGGDVDWRRVAEENLRVGKLVERLKTMEVPLGVGAEKLFLYFAKGLAREGLLSRCGVRAAARFLSALERAGVVDKSQVVAEKGGGQFVENLARTGVCVTGQMRSAPFTAASFRRALTTGIGNYEVFIVTERDDRVGSVSLFQPQAMAHSRMHPAHRVWVTRLLNSTVVHETLSTKRQLENYLMQLADMRDCLELVQKREVEIGRKFEYLVRMRPDTVLMGGVDKSWWMGVRAVVYGTRQAYYAMNDRFFAGDRALMGRLLSCHDLFWLLVGKGTVYHRKAGDATHMLWKKMINSERFLARCAAFKRVPLKPMGVVDARRVAYSSGVARWREF